MSEHSVVQMLWKEHRIRLIGSFRFIHHRRVLFGEFWKERNCKVCRILEREEPDNGYQDEPR